VAAALIEDTTLAAIEAELRARDAEAAGPGRTLQRTRVLTHVAWVPKEWEQAARGVLEGLQDRHPSRTIMLLPDPDSPRDALDADVDVRCFGAVGDGGAIASEVIELHLRGKRAAAPASVVQPLLVSDLPAFLRWRGELPFGGQALEQLVGVVDRLIVNGREWRDADATYRYLPTLFERVAVSDIAWSRTHAWREAVAALWPDVAEADTVAVTGPRADALLLAGWLSGRLRRPVSLEHEPASETERVAVDGLEATRLRIDEPSPSDLLSAELEQFGRDPIYEEAVWSSSSRRIS
jgi:glucose-6-phosphate dehydrogenase assembly protein OpcA